jgi:hypothetical protein
MKGPNEMTDVTTEQALAVAAATGPVSTREVPDFLHCVGEQFYPTPQAFSDEAAAYGISRRLRTVPESLVPGQSRVYLATGAGHDSLQRWCDNCAGSQDCPQCAGTGRVGKTLTEDQLAVLRGDVKKRGRRPKPTSTCTRCRGKGTLPADRVRLPDAAKSEGGKVTCARCGTDYAVRGARGGQIFGYFVPDRIEIVLKVTDDAAKAAALLLGGDLGLKVEGGPDDEAYRISGVIDADNPGAGELLKVLGVDAPTVQADLLGRLKALPGARLVGVVKEPVRGCGHRAHGGVYAVSTESPLVNLTPPIEYDGPHFRGIVALEQDESRNLDDHVTGVRTVKLTRRAEAGEAEVPTETQS